MAVKAVDCLTRCASEIARDGARNGLSRMRLIIAEGRTRVDLETIGVLVWRQFQVNAGEGQSERLRKPQAALGEFIGELALLFGAPRNATAVALEPTTLLVMDKDDFTALLAEQPAVESKVMAVVAQRMRYR